MYQNDIWSINMASDNKMNLVILGLLDHEDLTGYDIKKRIDGSLRYFWKGSFGSIYPALSSLEESGLIKKVKGKSSSTGREKIVYKITAAGRKNLLAWLSESKSSNTLKYETLLKLYFGGVADNGVSIATITEFEKEVEADLAVLNTYKKNLNKVLDERDHVFFYLTVTFGIETYEAYLRWCTDAKKILSGKKIVRNKR